jgi:hypothetical protein
MRLNLALTSSRCCTQSMPAIHCTFRHFGGIGCTLRVIRPRLLSTFGPTHRTNKSSCQAVICLYQPDAAAMVSDLLWEVVSVLSETLTFMLLILFFFLCVSSRMSHEHHPIMDSHCERAAIVQRRRTRLAGDELDDRFPPRASAANLVGPRHVEPMHPSELSGPLRQYVCVVRACVQVFSLHSRIGWLLFT